MYGRKKKEEKQTHNNFFYSSIQLKSSLCLWHITFYRVRTRGKETQRMKRCRNNNKLSTFISMEQFNVKWKIRQESIFHNSMLGCCSRSVITYTQSVNLSFFLFKKYKFARWAKLKSPKILYSHLLSSSSSSCEIDWFN